MNLNNHNAKHAGSRVPSVLAAHRSAIISQGAKISAASSASTGSVDYNLSRPVAANVSADASLNLPASSGSTVSAGDVAEQNNAPAVQPATGESSYQNSSAPVSQSANVENFYPASGGMPAYQSSSAGFSSPTPGSSATESASGSISPEQPSDSAPAPASPATSTASATAIPTGAPVNSDGQTNLDVTDFGAIPDAVQFYVNTVSNSYVVSVAGTNQFSSADIGKVIEVFRAGPWVTYSNWGPVVTQQDIICLITNVTDGTNLTLTIPCGWTMNAACIVGTNNTAAFQSAIDEASNLVQTAGYTNVTIDIPAGTYLLPSGPMLNAGYQLTAYFESLPALTISSGGITLMGDPAGGTVMMASGAGMEHLIAPGLPLYDISAGYAPYVPMRETLIECAGPVQNNQYPLVFQNLTLDGGVQNGAQDYNYWTLIQGNGEGWDASHHAVADWDGYVSYQMNMTKVFTNCVFQHWRGEMLICWTGNMKGAVNDIANCTFYDGNATADNMYYGQHIHGCTFNQVEKVTEYYQYNGDSPNVFEDNLVTNINGSALVINGATTNVIPPYFTIRNNTFYGVPNQDDIMFTPACNVIVSNNQFYGEAAGISFTAAGLQPADGSAAVMSNFVIVANNFHDTFSPIVADGYPVEDVLVSNNVSSGGQQFALAAGGWKTNWFFFNNSSPAIMNCSAVQAGTYFVDDPSDSLGWYTYNDYIGETNWVTYGNGCHHLIIQATPNSVFVFNSNPSLLPAGAEIQLHNMSALAVPVYTTLNAGSPPNQSGNNGNNNNSGGGNNNQSNDSNTNETSGVTLQELGQMYKSNTPINTFFEALFSMWFTQSNNSGITDTPNVPPAVSSAAVRSLALSVPENAPSSVTLAAGQTLTFVWNNGAWQQE